MNEFLQSIKVNSFIETLPFFERNVFNRLKETEDQRLLALIHIPEDDIQLFTLARLIAQETLKISHESWFNIFRSYSTDNVKRMAPSNHENRQLSLTYGEIDFFSFANILERAQPTNGEVFVDLGHGIGKGLICASLLYGHVLKRAYGVEIVSELHDLSLKMAEEYKTTILHDPVFSDHSCELIVEQGDLLSDSIVQHWIEADILFANSTCFDDILMRSMSVLAEKMRSGSRFITLTKQLPSNEFILLDRRQYVMSWGEATSFIHVRR